MKDAPPNSNPEPDAPPPRTPKGYRKHGRRMEKRHRKPPVTTQPASRRYSPLDDHRELLEKWDKNHLPLAEIQKRLLEEKGIKTGLGAISMRLARWKKERILEDRLRMIADGSATCRKVEAQFAQTPAPSLNAITNFFRVLIMEMASQGLADPEMLKLAGDLMKTALQASAEERKEKEFLLEKEKFDLLKKKADQADAARGVTDSPLTPEQKQARLREIFGLVPLPPATA